MKLKYKPLFIALLTLSAWSSTSAVFADDENVSQPQAQAQTSAPVTEATSATMPGQTPAPAAAEATSETIPSQTPAPAAEASAADASAQSEDQKVPSQEGSKIEKSPGNVTKIPVTGAFGIPLGERFAPFMVGKILGQEEKTYLARDENKTEHTGTRYRVEPNVPNPHFNEFLVQTNKDGIIYSITGKQTPEGVTNSCEVTKEIAIFLMDKYGKPRGRGILGEWFSFRDSAEGPYRGIRFNAHRCRNGRYSIVYSDDGAMMQEAPLQSKHTAGL